LAVIDTKGLESYRTETTGHYRWLALLYALVEPLLIPLKKRIFGILSEASGPILDVACGRGTQGRMLALRGKAVAGIDLSRAMLRGASRKALPSGTLVLVEGDGTSLPFREETFAASLITLALHEMPREIALATLREMVRVTVSGGLLVVADFRESLPWIVEALLAPFEPPYFRAYTRLGLDEYLRAVGLKPQTLSFHLFGTVALTVSVKS
jgi:ubiquinone/menaquinone biosynthesis C-methylase UbiE